MSKPEWELIEDAKDRLLDYHLMLIKREAMILAVAGLPLSLLALWVVRMVIDLFYL